MTFDQFKKSTTISRVRIRMNSESTFRQHVHVWNFGQALDHDHAERNGFWARSSKSITLTDKAWTYFQGRIPSSLSPQLNSSRKYWSLIFRKEISSKTTEKRYTYQSFVSPSDISFGPSLRAHWKAGAIKLHHDVVFTEQIFMRRVQYSKEQSFVQENNITPLFFQWK